jgi:hypothetical protein
MITCPPDVTLECSPMLDTSPASTGSATATDNCPLPVNIGFNDVIIPGPKGCDGNYIIERTWTATDTCGNTASCVQMITVDDTTPPSITCPADATIECGNDTSPGSTGTATAIDACSPNPTITFTDSFTPGCGNTGVIARTWTATDACGNTASCVQTITIVDTTPPSITCPADVTIDCEESDAPSNTGEASATDVCDPNPAITFTDNIVPGNCAGNYTIERTWTATDACGNSSSCMQSITVEDTDGPDFTPPADIEVECGTNLDDLGILGDVTNVTDNCSAIVDTTYADAMGENHCDGTGTIIRTWTVTDACGNSTSQTQNRM